MAKLVDPDDISYVVDTTAAGTDEMEVQTGAKTIQLLAQGTLSDASPGSTSGVTGQCVYSKCKEIWKSDSALNKHRFPIQMLYDESFLWINGWGPADDQTRDLVRDAGFREVDGRWNACMLSLGAFDAVGDQGYYTQVIGFDQTKTNFDKTGVVNENIAAIGTAGSPDYSGYFKAFLREEQKTFAEYNLLVEQILSALTYRAYRISLANGDDTLNAIDNDATIVGDAGSVSGVTYSELTIDYYNGQLFETAAAQSYVLDDVVQDGVGRWARCTTAGTVTTPGGAYASFAGTSVWEAYPGERLIGTTYYAFNRVLDVEDAGTTAARIKEIHSWAQWKLRQASDINDDVGGDAYGTVNGNIAKTFTRWVGSVIHTMPGVYIDNFDANDKNNIRMWDITVDGGGLDAEDVPSAVGASTEREFPFTSAGNLIFSDNFVDEVDNTTRYTAYFQYITDVDLADTIVENSAAAVCDFNYAGTDVGLLNHLQIGDYVAVTGFTTETGNNGLYEVTGAPTSNSVELTKLDGTNPTDEPLGDAANVKENPFESPGAVIVDDNSATDIDGEISAASIGWDFDYTNNVQGGRTADSDAAIIVVGIAYDGAQATYVNHVITKTTGQSITVTAVDELNYLNP